MEKSSTLLILALFCVTISAQSTETDSEFSRKGKFMIETGYNIVSGFSTGTGLSSIIQDGATLTSIGVEGGKMLTEDFGLKTNLSFLTGQGLNVSNFAAGLKYYMGGTAPLEFKTGYVVIGEFYNEVYSELSVGYPFQLSDNIYLEPTVGFWTELGNFGDDGSANFIIDISFAMFL